MCIRDSGGAGEGGHHHVGVAHQVLSGFAAGAGDDVDHAVGQARVLGRLREHQGGERGELGGLEDDGVARGDRREDLPGGHLERIVPGRDRADDPDGLTAYVRGVVARVLGGRLPLEVPGGAREKGGVVDGSRYVELRGQLDRLAALEGLGVREVLRLLGQDGRQPVQGVRALAGGGAGPAREGPLGGGDGLVDVRGARELVGQDLVAGRRIDHGV